MPTVNLENVIAAATADPPRRWNEVTAPADVKIVEAALVALNLLPSAWAQDGHYGTATRKAYSLWQQQLGYQGSWTLPDSDANGIPGIDSLTKLGQRFNFTVTSNNTPPPVDPPPVTPPTGTPGKIGTDQVDFSGAGTWQSGKTACTNYIHTALQIMGITDQTAINNWTTGELTIAERESAYNAPQWQVNLSDSNAVGAKQSDGAPFQSSRGVAQCIPQTFAAYHQAGTSLKIYDPVANFAASMNYIMAVYKVSRDGHDLASKVQQADPNRSPRGY